MKINLIFSPEKKESRRESEEAGSNLVFNLVNIVGSLCKFTAQPHSELDCSAQSGVTA